MAARSKPMAFRGCAPLAFRLTVADPTLLPALDLVFPNDAFMAVCLALDAVLKRVARLGELSNNFVATLSSAIFTQTGRKSRALPNGKFGKPFSAPAPLNPTRFGG